MSFFHFLQGFAWFSLSCPLSYGLISIVTSEMISEMKAQMAQTSLEPLILKWYKAETTSPEQITV